MSRTSRLYRSAAAMLLALLLAVRLLSPAGFMPAFDRGAAAIVACPDFDPPPPPMAMPGHHHHDPGKHRQPCPYAAGAAAATAADLVKLTTLLLRSAVVLLGRPFAFLQSNRARELPPSRAPPLPA